MTKLDKIQNQIKGALELGPCLAAYKFQTQCCSVILYTKSLNYMRKSNLLEGNFSIVDQLNAYQSARERTIRNISNK